MSSPDANDLGTAAKSDPRASWFGGASEDGDELVGTVLGNSYRVTGVLGEGAMGRVYAAEHTRLTGKRFAVKVLHPELMRHKQVLVRFEREAQATSILDHPNIVGVFDVDRTPDGRPYIVCEYLEGVELGQLLDDMGKLSLPAALHLARQLCRALSTAHQHGILHRDMKPENVFVLGRDRARPNVKVLDFGLARLESSAGNSLTQAGTIMGTPSYMAPEQARGDRVDARVDVYAVGAILYRSLTGRRPFEKEDPPATLAAVLTEEPPRPRSIDPAIPEDVEMVIQRAMARNAGERYQTVDELEAELAELEPASDRARAPNAPKAAPPPRRELSTLSSAPRASRPALVVLASIAVLWTMALIVSAATSAVELLMGRDPDEALSALELSLLVAAVCAFLVTPSMLGVRYLRDQVWNNTMKVLRITTVLRSVLFASMAAYGAAALSVRLVDAVLARVVTMRIAWPPSAAAWPGWPIVYFLVGAVAAGGAALSQRWVGQDGRLLGPMGRTFAGPVLTASATLLAAGIVYGGFVMRAGSIVTLADARTDSDTPAGERALPAEPGDKPAPVVAPTPSLSSSADTEEPAHERASASELNRAIGEGPAALEKLAKHYPDDVAVMKALVEATAKDAKTQLTALEWTGRLLDHEPALAEWKTITFLVLQASQGPEPGAERAFELMAHKMKHVGADLLYDLMVASKTGAKQRAISLLALPEVQENASPALRIAYELRTATSCEKQVSLLERAGNDGDARSVGVLSYEIEGTKRGCGYLRRSPCPAKCPNKVHQERMRAAIGRIKSRTG